MQQLGRQVRHGHPGGDGSDSTVAVESEPQSKPITKVVVKSTTGAAGTRKEDLRQLPSYQQAGVEITIQNNNNQMQNPIIEGDVVWETTRRGSPSSLKFTTVKDETLNFHEGNPVSFRFNGQNVFYGYVFSKSRSDSLLIDVTCYDQLRYLKNKDTISYENKTYADLVKLLAADYGLTVGTLADTKYKSHSVSKREPCSTRSAMPLT